MDTDWLVAIYKTAFPNHNELTRIKGSKTDDVMGLSPNHIFSSNNCNNYYINMYFLNFVNAIK